MDLHPADKYTDPTCDPCGADAVLIDLEAKDGEPEFYCWDCAPDSLRYGGEIPTPGEIAEDEQFLRDPEA